MISYNYVMCSTKVSYQYDIQSMLVRCKNCIMSQNEWVSACCC